MVFERNLCVYCNLCCRGTEMILFREDIARISSIGYRPEDFAEFRDGFYRLRNNNGRCVFLGDDGRCAIYSSRPIGCRVYPLVFSFDHGPVFDIECPLSRSSPYGCNEVADGLELLRRVLELMEAEYGVKVDWSLFEYGGRALLSRFCSGGKP